VTATDAAENVSAATTVSFSVDATPPAAPSVMTPQDGSAVNALRPTFSGTAEAASSISVTEAAGNNLQGASLAGVITALCTTTADANGNWSCAPDQDLAEGSYTVSVTATDAVANVSTATSVSFSVDVTAPAAPSLSGPEADSTVGARPTFSGTAEAGSTVTVKDAAGKTLCTTTAAECGGWRCTPSNPLSGGEQTLTVTATDAAGNVSAATEVRITVQFYLYFPFVVVPAEQ
jgi:hypothetical protein